MDDNASHPDTSANLPPDLPKPTIAQPTIKASDPVVLPPPVKLTIRDANEPRDDTPQAGQVVSFNTRSIAAIIDIAVASGLMIGVYMMFPLLASRLGWLIAAAYMVTRDSLPFLGGQSVGKKAMNLRVLTLENQSVIRKWKTAAIRNGVLFIPFFPFIELYVLLSREEKQERGRRLGDEWAKTKVVIAESALQEADEPVSHN